MAFITTGSRLQIEERERERTMKRMSLSCSSKVASVLILFVLVAFVSAKSSGDVTELQIGVKHKPKSCEVQAHKGDRIKVHYRGKLTDGTVFDSSFERGDPIEFVLGSGNVIKGWGPRVIGNLCRREEEAENTCKTWLWRQRVPPNIPGGATLIFDTELVSVNENPTSSSETIADDEL